MHECDLLVRSVQVHTSREERVCVCGGGGDRTRLVSGRNVKNQQMCEDKKKKMTKKKAKTEGRHDSAIFLLPALSSFCSSAAMATTHRLHRLCYISTAAK